MSALTAPVELYPANDFAHAVGPFTVVDSATGAESNYDTPTLTCYFTDAEDSDVPMGSVTMDAPQLTNTGVFVPSFTAAQMTTALSAAEDGDAAWLVVTGPGFRGVVQCVVRLARRLS